MVNLFFIFRIISHKESSFLPRQVSIDKYHSIRIYYKCEDRIEKSVRGFTWEKRQSKKTRTQIKNRWKHFFIAICCQSGDKWQSKLRFLRSSILLTFWIAPIRCGIAPKWCGIAVWHHEARPAMRKGDHEVYLDETACV